MNQILVTDKVIVTKEMRKKKKFYKRNIILSVFLMCILCSYYVYAEYDRNRYEHKSKDILNNLDVSIQKTVVEEDDTTIDESTFIASNSIMLEDDKLKVILGSSSDSSEEVKLGNILREFKSVVEEQQPITENQTTEEVQQQPETSQYTTEDGGITYSAEAKLKIPRLGIEYPVLSTWSDELLKISLNKLWGPNPNEVGNYVVMGHNYKNGTMFGKLKNINIGDVVEITDLTGRTIKYVVSEKYHIDPTDTSCTSQLTNGRRKITLITCAYSGSMRLVVQGYEQE